MTRFSAGLLPYRYATREGLEVLLVHPGGPFWARKDDGAWSIAKGEYEPGESPGDAAEREYAEELGMAAPIGERLELGEVRQSGGKRILAWALRADVDVNKVTSNLFEIEWPPKSGQLRTFPEVDRAGWFSIDQARTKLLKGQLPFLDRLVTLLRAQTS